MSRAPQEKTTALINLATEALINHKNTIIVIALSTRAELEITYSKIFTTLMSNSTELSSLYSKNPLYPKEKINIIKSRLVKLYSKSKELNCIFTDDNYKIFPDLRGITELNRFFRQAVVDNGPIVLLSIKNYIQPIHNGLERTNILNQILTTIKYRREGLYNRNKSCPTDFQSILLIDEADIYFQNFFLEKESAIRLSNLNDSEKNDSSITYQLNGDKCLNKKVIKINPIEKNLVDKKSLRFPVWLRRTKNKDINNYFVAPMPQNSGDSLEIIFHCKFDKIYSNLSTDLKKQEIVPVQAIGFSITNHETEYIIFSNIDNESDADIDFTKIDEFLKTNRILY